MLGLNDQDPVEGFQPEEEEFDDEDSDDDWEPDAWDTGRLSDDDLASILPPAALTGPIEFKGDIAVFKGGKPMTFGHVNHFEAPYVVKEGTFETWVRPETAEGKGAGGVFAFDGDRIRVTAGAKGWTLTTHGEYRRVDVWGPKVENRWTHVLVTFRDEILRFYIDGVEVRSENGPMRRQLSNPEGRNTFYRTISMSYGTDQVSWGEFFRGEAKGIRYTSKYTTAEEAKALATGRW